MSKAVSTKVRLIQCDATHYGSDVGQSSACRRRAALVPRTGEPGGIPCRCPPGCVGCAAQGPARPVGRRTTAAALPHALPAIVVAAFAGGIRVGFAAILFSALGAWIFWIGPPTEGAITPVRILTGLVFLLTGAATVIASGFARLLLDEVAEREEALARTTRESVHRIKNLLAVIQSISRKISMSAPDVNVYRERLDARLGALATAQEYCSSATGATSR